MANSRLPPLTRPVRMQEVAELADVSTMTVSRALRDPASVSDATLDRVSAAVRKLGYIPNQIASSLKTFNRTKLMGVIVPSVRNAIFADSLKGLSDELRHHGFIIMLADGHYSPTEEEALISAFLAQRARAIVLHETVHTPAAGAQLRSAGIPIVEIGNLSRKPLDMVVSYSNALAARAMTEHLVDRGYRRIAFISLPGTIPRSIERLKGYKSALKRAGIPFDEALIHETEGGYAAGARAMARVLDAKRPADAAFFAGDVLAVGGLLECQRRGVAVPSEMAIAGFDDLEIATQLTPALTTLRVPRYEIGKQAARLILRRLARTGIDEGGVHDVGFEVMAREST